MLTNTRRVQFWKLGQFQKFDEIIPLMKLDYRSSINGVTLNNSWQASVENIGKELSSELILEYGKADAAVRYLPVLANLEMLVVDPEVAADIPCHVAIEHHNCPIVFVENPGGIHVLVSAPSTCFSRIRTTVMHYIQQKKNIWGRIEYNFDLLNRSFFYWLLSKKGKTIKVNDELFRLEDVKGFRSQTEKRQHNYKGSGNSIDDEAPVQTMVCLNTDFTGLDLLLESTTSFIQFSLATNRETRIEFSDSHVKNGDQKRFFNSYELLLKIYQEIIPALQAAYNQDADWEHEENRFRKQLGLRAIKKIMAETGLGIAEIAVGKKD